MSESRKEEDGSSVNQELEPKAQAVGDGTWDPLASVRKTISPTQRLQLLKMPVPILPPEDFMDTADFQREHATRPRRFLTPVFGLLGVLLALLLVGLWSLFWSRPADSDENTDESRRALIPAAPPPAAHSSAIPPGAEPPLPAASLAPSTATAAANESPMKTQAPVKPHALEITTPKLVTPTPIVPRTESAPVQPKKSTPTPPNPEPAPTGITFWTQPR